jgi:hypothetical protein
MATNRALDGVLTKRANRQEKYTEKQIEDLLKCSDPNDGYLYFIKNFFYIQHPVKGKMLLEPYDYQIRLLQSYHNYTNTVNLCPRQVGKCSFSKTHVTLKNKHTNEVQRMPIGEFFEIQKANNS